MGGSTWSRFSAGSLMLNANSGHFQAKHKQDFRSPVHEWIPKVDNTASLVGFLQQPRGEYRILPVEKNERALSLKISDSKQKGDQINEKYTFKVYGKKE